ncbi:site-specific integrase [Pseudomonas sp. MAFF 301449]|uniref:Site-specific integrase n=2 Tax=Pseudomonas cyclaminis TaxID=2781239 RepID=A0ABR9SLL9_9PSED|nr:tyrosine-type recombinase/integrase [Pseudomonas cyclaminis]MBE8589810.1 site-specific integrase [Pseudomonas cyclaminis]
MNNKANFFLLKQVDVTCYSSHDPLRGTYTPMISTMPATFAVTWPNGTPCTMIELFLIHKFRLGSSTREDGGSLRAIVSKLIHLIRYCWNTQRDFWELDNTDIDKLIVSLMSDSRKNSPLNRARDNNTVRAIIASTVEFLLWIQNEIIVDVRLIGKGPGFRIRLKERKIFDHRLNTSHIQLVYHSLPPRDVKEPKRPISSLKRNALWAAVSSMTAKPVNPPYWAKNRDFGSTIDIYLKARRELLLELLEATGARPGELSRLSVSKNEDCDKSHTLTLVTLKRRRQIERIIPLQPSVAIRLTVFIKKHRRIILQAIRASGGNATPLDRVFLSVNGNATSERVMESEFNRLSKFAGLGNYQCCMSMFRHRFITKQVAIHLEFYLRAEAKTREFMTNSDYRTILRKVATVTGHASELSLLHYIDLAWDELGFGNQIDKFIAIDASLESTTTQVISIIGLLEKPNGQSSSELLRSTKEALLNIKSGLLRTLECNATTKPKDD